MSLLVSASLRGAASSAASPVAAASTALTAATTAAGCSRELRSPPSCEGKWASRQLGFDLSHVVRDVVIKTRVGRASHELTESSVGLREAVVEHGDEQTVVNSSPSSTLDIRMGDHHLVILQPEIVLTKISARINVR
jgi:hypothetical protein